MAWNGFAYINLVIYGDDATTPATDEGMNGGEDFFLHIYDSSEDSILIYKSTDSIVSFSGWTNTNGAPLTQYGDANVYMILPSLLFHLLKLKPFFVKVMLIIF